MLLTVTDLHASYSGIRALAGVSLNVAQGEMVALIGPNGAGKSTLLNCISGIVRPGAGQIRVEEAELVRKPAWAIARMGILQSPEGRQVLPDMSVIENLRVGANALHGRRPTHDIQAVFRLFPILRERQEQLAGSLSGGQQQMLAIGRALMGGPRLLLLDEPSLGLAPVIVQQVFDALAQLRRDGMTILLVEQNARKALQVSDRAYVIEHGHVVAEGPSRRLAQDDGVIAHYLGTGGH
ncbi:ABC transporter ATP-binding protein (plasmid) [Paracoccus versutus]|uniref:Amino acid/amide ABC transporter ATP-binding protein 2 (HAAT family) n=2 Tax=Paracoccus versutus TaxID=34007 RepID=A0AAQ0HEW5_PARVE|nr:ABC transporter ATP-binding protein [Paracoccus versutus]KGJ09220.1 amino acid ABC transporter ATPase [Paracoccus versutus]REG37989.1 amino acid/amide ABC transporter ATP-binding protein 2 (HAAT family) [Paracoccus versutus]WEJ80855.1 ABC transporter ATP-binding protein [Paracoccus versutus]